jgi:hypothetical protein
MSKFPETIHVIYYPPISSWTATDGLYIQSSLENATSDNRVTEVAIYQRVSVKRYKKEITQTVKIEEV